MFVYVVNSGLKLQNIIVFLGRYTRFFGQFSNFVVQTKLTVIEFVA